MSVKKNTIISALIFGGAAISMPVGSVFATNIDSANKATVPAYLTAEATQIDVTIGTGINIVTPEDGSPFLDSDNDGQKDEDEKTVVLDEDGTAYIDEDEDGVLDENETTLASTVTDAVYMNLAEDTNEATVTDLKVINNSKAAPLYVKGITTTGTDPYDMVEFNADNFKTYAANSHKFALQITGINDEALAEDAKVDLSNGYTPAAAEQVKAEDTQTYNLDGLASVTTEAITESKIADVVITVSQAED